MSGTANAYKINQNSWEIRGGADGAYKGNGDGLVEGDTIVINDGMVDFCHEARKLGNVQGFIVGVKEVE